jgi:hypothetical protein
MLMHATNTTTIVAEIVVAIPTAVEASAVFAVAVAGAAAATTMGEELSRHPAAV